MWWDGVPAKAVTASGQFLVEVVKHEIAKDGRKRAALRRSLIHRTDQTVFHHPGVEKRPDEFEHTLIGHSRGGGRHQAVVIDSVEKLFEIEIDHDVVAVGDITLRLSHCLMAGAPRSKAVTVLGERRVPPLLGLIDSWCKRRGYGAPDDALAGWRVCDGMRHQGAMKTLIAWSPAAGLNVVSVERGEQAWTVSVHSRQPTFCPGCGARSESRHSTYWRTLWDLSAQGTPVVISARLGRWRVETRSAIGASSPSAFRVFQRRSRAGPPAWRESSGCAAIARAGARRSG